MAALLMFTFETTNSQICAPLPHPFVETYTSLNERVRLPDICVCVCVCVSGRELAQLSHLIVIASVFGLETVDRNQQSPVVVVVGVSWGVMEGCVSHFPVS